MFCFSRVNRGYLPRLALFPSLPSNKPCTWLWLRQNHKNTELRGEVKNIGMISSPSMYRYTDRDKSHNKHCSWKTFLVQDEGFKTIELDQVCQPREEKPWRQINLVTNYGEALPLLNSHAPISDLLCLLLGYVKASAKCGRACCIKTRSNWKSLVARGIRIK